MNKILFNVFVLVISFQISINAQPNIGNKKQLDDVFTKALKTWNVSGMAVAIVSADSVLYSKGFGYLSTNKKQLVNSQTIFGIASVSKTFVSALSANIFKSHNIPYDTVLHNIMPDFKMHDNYVTSVMTIEDAMSHRTGLQNFSGDLSWYGSTIDENEIIHRIRYLKPKYGFRTHFGYSNIMFLTVGVLLERLTHAGYSQLLDSLVFTPLGMTSSFSSFKKVNKINNLALPNIEKNGTLIEQPYICWDNMKPAGGIFSNVADLSKYLQMWLHYGKYNNYRLVDSVTVQKLWSPHIVNEKSFIDSKLNAPVNFKAYGLGWSMMDFSGQKIILHNGGLDGVTSQLFLIPSKNIGVIMLCNKTTVLPIIMMYQLLDRFINKSQRSWSSELSDLIKKYKPTNFEKSQSEDVEKVNYAFYQGVYYDSLVGKTTIKYDSGILLINCHESTLLKGVLKPIGMLEFELSWPLMTSLPKGKVEFKVDAVGEVSGFKINLPNPDMHFDELYFNKQK